MNDRELKDTGSTPAERSRSSGREYREALDAVLEDVSAARERESAARPAPKSGRARRLVLTLLAVAGIAVAALVNYQYALPPEPPAGDVQRRASLIMMFSAVKAVEEHRSNTGTLPADLSEVNVPTGSWTYQRADTGYTLVISQPDVSLTYRSGENQTRLLEEAGVR